MRRSTSTARNTRSTHIFEFDIPVVTRIFKPSLLVLKSANLDNSFKEGEKIFLKTSYQEYSLCSIDIINSFLSITKSKSSY